MGRTQTMDEGEQGKKTLIQWDPSQMATGFAEVDEQHKEWIARFNQFSAAVMNDRGEELWQSALLFFMQYTERHFKTEEALMKKTHCVTEGVNQAAHRKFEARLHEISYMTWPLGATKEDMINLQQELANWLRNHICVIDVQLRDHVPGQ